MARFPIRTTVGRVAFVLSLALVWVITTPRYGGTGTSMGAFGVYMSLVIVASIAGLIGLLIVLVRLRSASAAPRTLRNAQIWLTVAMIGILHSGVNFPPGWNLQTQIFIWLIALTLVTFVGPWVMTWRHRRLATREPR